MIKPTLNPEPLAFELQKAKLRPYRLFWFESLASTQDELSKPGYEPLDICLTNIQSAGRSQRENQGWHGLSKDNLYLSWIEKLPASFQSQVTSLSGVVGLSLYQALQPLNLELHLKWPNDLIVFDASKPGGYRKLGGILVESFWHEDHLRVIIGLGLNLHATHFPATLPSATSLILEAQRQDKALDFEDLMHLEPSHGLSGPDSESSPKLSKEKVLARILGAFEQNLATWLDKGFTPLSKSYQAALGIQINQRLWIAPTLKESSLEVVYKGIDPQGGLIVWHPDKGECVFYHGEVSLRLDQGSPL